jgi:hypothetical protein
MDENPYEAPQVERSEAERAPVAAGLPRVEQFSLFDGRVLAVAFMLVALGFLCSWVMPLFVDAMSR